MGVSGTSIGLAEGGRRLVSPSWAAGTRSAVAARDSSVGAWDSFAEEEGSSAEEGHSPGAVVKGSLGLALGVGLLPGAGSSVCRAVAGRTLFGSRGETSEVVGSSFADLLMSYALSAPKRHNCILHRDPNLPAYVPRQCKPSKVTRWNRPSFFSK